jgi:uncharacterized protein
MERTERLNKTFIENDMDLEICALKLKNYFSRYNGAIVAFSGGVDSALLAYVAHLVLGNRMVAAIADSPSLARREYRFALNFAREHNIPLRIIHTREMENPLYVANSGNRCYYCKKALFETIEKIQRGLEMFLDESNLPVFFGANPDDLGDYRPGMRAAREASVRSPYIELDINKETIRGLCAYYGLEIADKPAMPCMSSRIIYGEEVTLEKLNQIERAEDFLYELGLRVLRVRHHGHIAKIEVPLQDFGVILENKERINKRFNELGFVYASLDLDGFKSGSLNAILK